MAMQLNPANLLGIAFGFIFFIWFLRAAGKAWRKEKDGERAGANNLDVGGTAVLVEPGESPAPKFTKSARLPHGYNEKEAVKVNLSSERRLGGIHIYDAYMLGNISKEEYERLKDEKITLNNVGKINMIQKIAVFFMLLFAGLANPFLIKNAKTGSMPVFQEQDYIEVTRVPFKAIKAGDIICFRPNTASLVKFKDYSPLADFYLDFFNKHTYLCHRVLMFHKGAAITKADISDIPDPFLVKSEDYFGRVIS